MSKIKEIRAREILSSGGAPTIEATVILDSGAMGKASVAFGASAGSREAVTLIDSDEKRYGGKGMLMAIKNIEEKIEPILVGMEVTEQVAIDKKMIELDGTEQKSNLGGNAILAVSLAVARAGAIETKQELWKYLGNLYGIDPSTGSGFKLPKPMVVMIEGGKHADKTTDLQEYLVSALGERSIKEMVRMEMEIYEALKKILKAEELSVNVGNEGAFAPSGIVSNEKPMEYLMRAIETAGYRPGVDCGISLDAAGSEFFDVRNKIYDLRIEQKKLTSDELIEYYLQWIGKYPFVSWEDMLDENDWEGWVKLTEKIDGKFPNIADDLTVTNTKLWQKALDMKAASAILIKLNQAGTLTETVECCKLAKEKGLWVIPSHRGGGETNDTFMVDLAVAVGAEYIKCGPTRGERVEKYNRLMEIEDQISY